MRPAIPRLAPRSPIADPSSAAIAPWIGQPLRTGTRTIPPDALVADPATEPAEKVAAPKPEHHTSYGVQVAPVMTPLVISVIVQLEPETVTPAFVAPPAVTLSAPYKRVEVIASLPRTTSFEAVAWLR